MVKNSAVWFCIYLAIWIRPSGFGRLDSTVWIRPNGQVRFTYLVVDIRVVDEGVFTVVAVAQVSAVVQLSFFFLLFDFVDSATVFRLKLLGQSLKQNKNSYEQFKDYT